MGCRRGGVKTNNSSVRLDYWKDPHHSVFVHKSLSARPARADTSAEHTLLVGLSITNRLILKKILC